jgi:periplasmic protein TonB
VAREIFGEIAHPTRRLGSQSRYTLPVSILAHVVIAACVVIVPLMATDVLPAPHAVIGVFTAPPSPPPPPPAAPVTAARVTKPEAISSPDAAPREAPSAIGAEPATTSSAIGDPLGVKGGFPNGVVGSVGVVPDVPAVPQAPPAPTGPLPVGGKIKEPAKIRHVPPVYPAVAQQARIQGVVVVEAVIGIDGRVKHARVLQSKPFLDDAALTAVKQWIFTPTTLNGVPVPVIMTVTVNFKLNYPQN